MPTSLTVDSHQHFWSEPSREDYPWMSGAFAPIRRTFTPTELAPLLASSGIDYSVLVQTRSSLAETRSFLELASQTEFIAGVVGWVDLTDPTISATLRMLRATPNGRYLVGIRHQVHDELDADWLLRPDVVRGLKTVHEAGLAYDLLVRPRELPAALAVAEHFPEMRLVIDHIAKPPISSNEIAGWTDKLSRFRSCGNVYCKLSGMVTEADWSAWSRIQLAPYVESVIQIFGADRLMFGSDWPVCLLAASYGEVADTARGLIRDLPTRARTAILGENAIRFYRLDRNIRAASDAERELADNL